MGTNNTSRLDTNRSDLTETPLAERQRAGGHRVAERHRVGRKTQLDKNAVYTNNEIEHKDKHGLIQSGGNKNVSGSKVTHKERESHKQGYRVGTNTDKSRFKHIESGHKQHKQGYKRSFT